MCLRYGFHGVYHFLPVVQTGLLGRTGKLQIELSYSLVQLWNSNPQQEQGSLRTELVPEFSSGCYKTYNSPHLLQLEHAEKTVRLVIHTLNFAKASFVDIGSHTIKARFAASERN